MRKWLEGIALLALGLHIAITVRALFGSDHLPERIPIQFDAAGHATGWGSPAMLILFPAVTLIIYLLFTVVTRFPGAFNYPVKVNVFNRRRMENLARDMMAWLKVEVVGLLTWMQWVTIPNGAQSRANSTSHDACGPGCCVCHGVGLYRADVQGGQGTTATVTGACQLGIESDACSECAISSAVC